MAESRVQQGEKDAEQRRICPNCGGSGDLGTFHGESRFVITHEECPFCCGFGYIFADGGNAQADESGEPNK